MGIRYNLSRACVLGRLSSVRVVDGRSGSISSVRFVPLDTYTFRSFRVRTILCDFHRVVALLAQKAHYAALLLGGAIVDSSFSSSDFVVACYSIERSNTSHSLHFIPCTHVLSHVSPSLMIALIYHRKRKLFLKVTFCDKIQ